MLFPCLLKGALVTLRLLAAVLGEYGLVFRAVWSVVFVASALEAIGLEPELRLGVRRPTTVSFARPLGLRLLNCRHWHGDKFFDARSRRLHIGVIMLACSIAAFSSQRTHGCLPSIVMLVQDDLMLASLYLVRVLPLNGLNLVLVSLGTFITSHFIFELLGKYVEQSIEELRFIVDQVGGLVVEMFLSHLDALLDVVLHGASAPVVEESTSTHLNEHGVTLVLKAHRLPTGKSIALFSIGPCTSSFVP